MKSYFAYIRVSTTLQGEEGVSLQEQRASILEYASRRGLIVTEWFEEQISAAKRGRPVFSRLVKLLKSKKAGGLIIHKIDRGARNLRNWADVAELMDRGIDVHFAHESIDLHTRSGRLSADILAVVAADYIRNLREEVVKGINGRLRQGYYPFAAPLGYVNNGGGKPKTIDPVKGPLIKLAFELYASREYTLQKLQTALFERGLRTRTGKVVYLSQFGAILRNQFYMGLVKLKNRKETFPGIHPPLIPSSLFNQVQLILDGKRTRLKQKNRFLFRLFIRCEHCKLLLYGERKKGHVYYRCHRRTCPITCIRQERLQEAVMELLKRINISPEEEPILKDVLREFSERRAEVSRALRHELQEEFERVQTSLKTILQKFLDGGISKDVFDDGHGPLLMQRSLCEERISRLSADHDVYWEAEGFIARLRTLCEKFCAGHPDETGKILHEVFQDISTSGKMIHLHLSPIMDQLASRERTRESWQRLLPFIVKTATAQ